MLLFRSQDNIFTKYDKQHNKQSKTNTLIYIYHTQPNKMSITEMTSLSRETSLGETSPLFSERPFALYL